jgi:SAM-dependent methyltransferase
VHRILLTNNHLVQPGGSETWTYTVAQELLRRGFDVTVLALERGPFAGRFECPVVGEVEGVFDLALVNHNSCMDAALLVAERTIVTCHGVYPDLEQPVPGADLYVAVSEEVLENLQYLGFDGLLIANPVDCTRFAPTMTINSEIRTVLSLCQGEQAEKLIVDLCAAQDLELLSPGGDGRVFDVETLMQQADLVVGLGRTVMEAMACGRAALVLDSRSYSPYLMDGMVRPENADEMLRCNFSGRRFQRLVTEEDVAAEIGLYTATMGEWNRQWALRTVESRQQVDRYLELAGGIGPKPRLAKTPVATEYTPAFYQCIDEGSLRSAEVIAALVWRLLQPKSVIDLGCGVGNLLSVFRDAHGVEDVIGVDGGYVDASMLKIPEDRFAPHDLNDAPYVTDRRFDLAMALEVAEHLDENKADAFVESLCALSSSVLFSAAIPLQGGTHHVNEQWPEYWVARFGARGYRVLDPFRPELWEDENVEWWYAQNLLLFVDERTLDSGAALQSDWIGTGTRRLALVHPRLWMARNRSG